MENINLCFLNIKNYFMLSLKIYYIFLFLFYCFKYFFFLLTELYFFNFSFCNTCVVIKCSSIENDFVSIIWYIIILFNIFKLIFFFEYRIIDNKFLYKYILNKINSNSVIYKLCSKKKKIQICSIAEILF